MDNNKYKGENLMGEKVPITEEMKALGWAKYYDKPLAPVPKEKLKFLENPLETGDILRIEDRNRLFEPGYLAAEVGYGVLEDGSGYIANLTPMPGVTTEMFDWWFAWHGLGDLRYTIWDPEDHYYAKSLNAAQGKCPKLSLKEKYWGTTHLIKEDIGGGPDELFATFRQPQEMGFDEEKIGTKACGTIVTSNSGTVADPSAMSVVMCHFVRETEDGIELRSRFWLGWHIVAGKPVKILPDGAATPLIQPKMLLAHNMKEFQNLADLLPRIYPEQKDNWE